VSAVVSSQQRESFNNVRQHDAVNLLPHFNGMHRVANRSKRFSAFLQICSPFGNLKYLLSENFPTG